jgi:hypothetical protein
MEFVLKNILLILIQMLGSLLHQNMSGVLLSVIGFVKMVNALDLDNIEVLGVFVYVNLLKMQVVLLPILGELPQMLLLVRLYLVSVCVCLQTSFAEENAIHLAHLDN